MDMDPYHSDTAEYPVRQLGTTERTMFPIMNFPLNAVIKATVAVWATIA